MDVDSCILSELDVCYNGCTGSTKPNRIDTGLNDEGLDIIRRSRHGTLGPRLVSFKGLITPVKDLRGRALLPLVLVASAQVANFVWQNISAIASLLQKLISNTNNYRFLWQYHATAAAVIAAIVLTIFEVLARFFLSGPLPTYLIDYACFKPADECKMDNERYISLAAKSQLFNEKSLDFMGKILASSGLGPETYVPPSMHAEPPNFSLANCMQEAEATLFTTVNEVLTKNGVKPHQIGILVVNCSVFCPHLSMAAMVVNHFKMREDIETFNHGGMGCSVGVIAVNLATDLLQVHKDTYAILLSTEMVSASGLQGK